VALPYLFSSLIDDVRAILESEWPVGRVEGWHWDLADRTSPLEHANLIYRAWGVRKFAQFLVSFVHKKHGLSASEALYACVARYGLPIQEQAYFRYLYGESAALPEFETMRGFAVVAKELFGESERQGSPWDEVLDHSVLADALQRLFDVEPKHVGIDYAKEAAPEPLPVSVLYGGRPSGGGWDPEPDR
jgi:hypothetical protein